MHFEYIYIKAIGVKLNAYSHFKQTTIRFAFILSNNFTISLQIFVFNITYC